MGGITSGIGIFSGIDTASLIEQILAVEARPRLLAQRRLIQLQTQQSSYLDINNRLSALQTAAAALRTSKAFDGRATSSTKPEALTALAKPGAPEGAFTFLVDRLVTTQGLLSKGFADPASGSPFGAASFTFEGVEARLDRDISLSDLNGGAGIQRGRIQITDTDGTSATVDLSRAGTVGEVLAAINSAGIGVTATVEDGAFKLVDTAGGPQSLTVVSLDGATTAETLGIAKSGAGDLLGDTVYGLHAGVQLSDLNDGNGVFIANVFGGHDFTVTVDGVQAKINLGDIIVDGKVETPRAASVADVLGRINTALGDAGITDVEARVRADGLGLEIVDTVGGRTIEVAENTSTAGTTAADLGLLGSATTMLSGSRIFAGLNTTLVQSLLGGSGALGDGTLTITDRSGGVHNLTLDLGGNVSGLMADIASQTGGAVTASLDANGTGLILRDTTGGAGNFIVEGNTVVEGADTAAALGISTGPGGVAQDSVASGNLQHQYISRSTLLSTLNNGRGVGTGRFRITDATGATAVIDIGDDARTIHDVLKEINSAGIAVEARINATGDGIEIVEDLSGGGSPGTVKIKIEDESGSVATRLRIAGEAQSAGASNTIDGSFEAVVEFDAADTLEDVVAKINSADVGVRASLVNDGTGSTPYHLSLTADTAGLEGRFLIDTGGFDLGLTTLEEGQNARLFFGSTDPAKAVLLNSTSNTFEGVLRDVTLEARQASEDPVTISITSDSAELETKIQEFIDAFNDLVDRIDFHTRYDQETEARGALLGDSAALTARSQLFAIANAPADSVSGSFRFLAEVGVTIGSGGKLELDAEQLRKAIAEDAEGVKNLFVAREIDSVGGTTTLPSGIVVRDPEAKETFSSLGVVAQLEEFAKSYINSIDGVLTVRNRTLDTQIELQEQRIQAFNVRLETRRLILQRQFVALERAIGQLQSQQASLGSIARVG
ncbi:MAG: flagellar filament capping protein FliD [Phycisphaerales bacterium JB039]